jgi:hypothetical protein
MDVLPEMAIGLIGGVVVQRGRLRQATVDLVPKRSSKFAAIGISPPIYLLAGPGGSFFAVSVNRSGFAIYGPMATGAFRTA